MSEIAFDASRQETNLTALAADINKEWQSADAARIVIGRLLVKARGLHARQGTGTWPEWCAANIRNPRTGEPRSYRDIQRLIALVKSDDPNAAAKAEREIARRAMQRARDKRLSQTVPVEVGQPLSATHAVAEVERHNGEHFSPSSVENPDQEFVAPATDREYWLTLGDGVLGQTISLPTGSNAAAITKLVCGLVRTLALADHRVRVQGEYEVDDQWEPCVRCCIDDPRATGWVVLMYDEEDDFWDIHSDHASLDEAVAAADVLRAGLGASVASDPKDENPGQGTLVVDGEAGPGVADDETQQNPDQPPTNRPDALVLGTQRTRPTPTGQHKPHSEGVASRGTATARRGAPPKRRVCALSIGCQSIKLCAAKGRDYCAEAQKKAAQKAA